LIYSVVLLRYMERNRGRWVSTCYVCNIANSLIYSVVLLSTTERNSILLVIKYLTFQYPCMPTATISTTILS